MGEGNNLVGTFTFDTFNPKDDDKTTFTVPRSVYDDHHAAYVLMNIVKTLIDSDKKYMAADLLELVVGEV